MGEVVLSVVVICVCLMISGAWKAFNWLWLKPKKMEKCFTEQGIKGPPYKFFYGNIKDLMNSEKEATSKPMELSHRIVPRVMPFFHRMAQEYGKMSFTWFGPVPSLTVVDPDMIRDILSDKSGDIRRPPKSNPFSRLLATGLGSYEGEKWVKHRKIIKPAFHQEKLKVMLPAFYASCNEMITKWHTLILGESCELDVWPELGKLSADVISRAAFGSSYEEGRRIFQLQTEQVALVTNVAKSMYIPGFRFLPTKSNNRMKEIYNEVRSLLKNMITKRENAMKTGETHKDDLLGLLIDSNLKEIKDNVHSKNAGMSIDEVIEECKLFYLAGQETTSSLLVWTLIVLSMHRDWQEKAREEVLQEFGRRKPDFDELSHLKVVTMILNEVLRLYSPAIALARATYKKIKIGEIVLPSGTQLMVPTLLIQRDREIWGEDAEEFNPERFSEGVSKAAKKKYSFLPFGYGPRVCIGANFSTMEAKMAIVMILQNFSFELSSAYAHAPYLVITLQPQYGAPLILHKF